jgi:hypothetical protein
MRLLLILVALTISSLTSLAQVQSDINALLIGLSGQSENITKDTSVIKLISKGEKLLPALSKKFTDSTKSLVFSKCASRFLTRGEIAIIIADHIEGMPYFTLTGLQNCTLDMCKDNPNFVEYYLDFIKLRGMTATFQKRYNEWLNSSDRKKNLKTKS